MCPGSPKEDRKVFMLCLGSGLVCKQRKRIKASHGVCCSNRKHISAPENGGRACMDAELAAAFRFPGKAAVKVEVGGNSCTSTVPKTHLNCCLNSEISHWLGPGL